MKWIEKELDETQLPDNIRSLVCNLARKLIGLSCDITTKERVAETFDAALAKKQGPPPHTHLSTNYRVSNNRRCTGEARVYTASGGSE